MITYSKARQPLAAHRLPRRAALGVALGGLPLLALPGAALANTHDEAKRFIDDLVAQVIAVLQNSKAPEDIRRNMIGVLRQATDLESLGRIALGRYWRSATPQQQAAYQDLFGDYVLETAAERFSYYSGERVVVMQARPAGRRDVVVASRLVPTDGRPPLDVAWRVRRHEGRLAIIDVVVGGVSLVLTHRDEFAAVISRHGMDGLLALLRDRAQNA